jgi:hypothetical protein
MITTHLRMSEVNSARAHSSADRPRDDRDALADRHRPQAEVRPEWSSTEGKLLLSYDGGDPALSVTEVVRGGIRPC